MASKIDKLLWMDIEYTHKDTNLGKVMEIAVIATKGKNFTEMGRLDVKVKLDEATIDQMKNSPLVDWSSGKPVNTGRTIYDMHTDNGLIDEIRKYGIDKDDAEKKLVKFIEKHFDEGAYLVGNSIRFDRAFLTAQWPEVEELLHYRMIDITAFKLALRMRGVKPFVKKKTHIAMDDVEESIEEMRYYLDFINV